MSLAEANLDLPANFAGIVKIFPLPNLVLFPGVIQPLHIFEPRYRCMMRDALEGDQLIAMATLKADHGAVESRRPAIFSTVCVGKIVTHNELPDGRFNLLLCGARRASVIRELPSELPYRMADVRLLEPGPSDLPAEQAGPMRKQVLELFQQLVERDQNLDREAFSGMACGEMPLGLLLDLIAFSCGTGVSRQQQVLDAVDVHVRGNRLIEILKSRLDRIRRQHEVSDSFPPAFSCN